MLRVNTGGVLHQIATTVLNYYCCNTAVYTLLLARDARLRRSTRLELHSRIPTGCSCPTRTPATMAIKCIPSTFSLCRTSSTAVLLHSNTFKTRKPLFFHVAYILIYFFSLTCVSRCGLPLVISKATLSNCWYSESKIAAPFFASRTLFQLTAQCRFVFEPFGKMR